MKITEKLNGKKVLIWGYGKEGKSTERFLQKFCKPLLVTAYEGKIEDIDSEKYDVIVKSPGIPYFTDDPRFTSQTALFLEQFRDRVIGVTGTKGKSTTASMIYEVLVAAFGEKVVLLGNIGVPCLDCYEQMTEDTIAVFEMSCHQLADLKVSPHISVFLNIFEEHLDYYGTFENYFAAKCNIANYQKEGDVLLIGDEVPLVSSPAKRIVFSKPEEGKYELFSPALCNQYNADIAYYVATECFGLSGEAVRERLKAFKGLSHRLEFVGCVDGVDYYDDSISTIPEATINAAESIPNVHTLLVGGMDRGIHYDKLVSYIEKRQDLLFVLMYATGKRIYQQLDRKENVVLVEDLAEAVETAKERTPKGRSCVMSPAAASYGYFENFMERGKVYVNYIYS